MTDPRPHLPPASGATRRRKRVFEFKSDIPAGWNVLLGVLVWVLFFALWEFITWQELTPAVLFPGPVKVVQALYVLFAENGFHKDVLISVNRVLISFALASACAVPLGILMGSFRAVEAFLSPLVSAWRYLPAPSLIPLLLMWFGAMMMRAEARAELKDA